MTLPGKLTLGYLEEDIPQKAYFRIRPLFIKDENAFEPYENASDVFPDEGGIRIVPDKNESSRFKARMRTLGRYCKLDLTKHPNENEKIRPNKNYNPEKQELNRFIVYSDVIAACPETLICEVLRPDKEVWDEALVLAANRPGTRVVCVAHQGVLSGPWQWTEVDNGLRLNRDEDYEPFDCAESGCKYLTRAHVSGGDSAEILVAMDNQPLFKRLNAPEADADGIEASANADEKSAQADAAPPEHTKDTPCAEEHALLEQPAETDDPTESAPCIDACAKEAADGAKEEDSETEGETELTPRAEADAHCAPKECALNTSDEMHSAPAEASDSPVEAEALRAVEAAPAEAKPQPRLAPPRPAEAQKPAEGTRVSARAQAEAAKIALKINGVKPTEPIRPIEPVRPVRSEMPKPNPRGSARYTPRDAAAYSQTGLNPRKGRSLSEVVDDLWRKSRLDQLGHPVPPEACGQPVQSPIERAAESAKAAWSLKEARRGLIDALSQLEGFADSMAQSKAGNRTGGCLAADSEELAELEAERLKLLGEIDVLRAKRLEKRAELYDEVKEAHAQEMQRLEGERARLKTECEARLREAESARKAHADAARLMDASVRDNFDKGFMDFAVYSRAAQLIRGHRGADAADYMRSPDVYEPTGAQLVSDIRKLFEDCGRPMENDEAVNLLACLALGRFVLISGETGAGKSSLSRLLAQALGLCEPGAKRFVCLCADGKRADAHAEYTYLTEHDDMRTLRVLMLDDANAVPCVDQSRGLLTCAEDPDKPTSLRVIMTVQDDQLGYPLDARLLDRAFMIRINPSEHPRAAWKRAQTATPRPGRTPSMQALVRAFNAGGDVPGDVGNRLSTLMDKLGALHVHFSARTLDDMYAYCASVIPLMIGSPMKALDYALSQRALPHLLATAQLDVIQKLPELLPDMPMCINLLNQPLPLPPM